MARNGSGTYNLLTNSWNPATNGNSATAVDWQNLINDIAAALTQSLSADGQTPMTGNLNAGNNKLTGLAAGTSAGQSIRWEQVFTAPASFGGGAINVDASGNVGIGTTSPAYKLDVRGGVIAGGDGTIVGGISYSTRPEIGAISNHPVGFITNNTTQMLLATSGNLGIGTTSPGTKLDVAGDIAASSWRGRANGSAPTADCAVYRPDDNTLGFSTANTERARLDSTGNFLMTSSTGALGYGTGAGGTVTQATSKSTAVTLNRPSGRITMNSATLNANTTVVFSLNNSTMQLGDTLSVAVVGGAAGAATYEVACFSNNSAPAYITLKNITGGALSEAVQIQFNVIRGSTT